MASELNLKVNIMMSENLHRSFDILTLIGRTALYTLAKKSGKVPLTAISPAAVIFRKVQLTALVTVEHCHCLGV